MKKRSLFAATAMLLVAVIVATSATYAWFTTANTASATVEMGVATGSSLEISADGSTFKNILTAQDITDNMEGTAGCWSDFSTTDAEFATAAGPLFYSENDVDGNGVLDATEYKADATIQRVTITFRSTKSDPIKLATNSAFTFPTDAKASLANATRIAIDSNTDATDAIHTFVGKAAGTTNNAIDAAGAAADNTYTYTAINATDAAIVNLASEANADGYFYGTATFYFFIEGTEANNGSLAGLQTTDKISVNLSFAQ